MYNNKDKGDKGTRTKRTFKGNYNIATKELKTRAYSKTIRDKAKRELLAPN